MLSESQELQLIEKADLRFVLASSDEALERSLDIFFPALLLKLNSPHSSSRKAVFNSIKNVMGRIGSLKGVKLPTRKLLLQAKNESVAEAQGESLVGLYSLLFASRGIDRMSNDEKKMLVPDAIAGISSLSDSLKPRMFNIVCKLVLNWNAIARDSPEEKEMRGLLNVGSTFDKVFLLEKFRQFFLLNPVKADAGSANIPRGYSCPGLSVQDVEFFTYNAGVSFSREQLSSYKRGIFRFVMGGFVEDDQDLLGFLTVVSTDSTELSDQAITCLKKLKVPLEDPQYVKTLVSLYTGDKSVGRPPVGHLLQEKILSVLSNSIIATKDPESVSLISSIGLNSSHYKLRSLSLAFVQHVARHNTKALVSDGSASGFSMSIASLIRNNLHNEGWPKFQLNSSVPNFSLGLEQRRMQYETLGVVLKQDPSLLTDFSYIEFLIDSLKGDQSEFRMTVYDTLSSLCPFFSSFPESSKLKLKASARKILSDNHELLYGDKDSKESIMYCRAIMMKFLNAAFTFDDVEARMFNVMGSFEGNRQDVREESSRGLHPYWFRMTQALNQSKQDTTLTFSVTETKDTQFPDVQLLISYLLEELKNPETYATSSLYQCLPVAVHFILEALVSQATQGKKTAAVQDEHWKLRVEEAIGMDDKVRTLIGTVVKSLDSSIFSKFCQFLVFQFTERHFQMNANQLDGQELTFSSIILILVEYAPDSVLRDLHKTLPQLMKNIENHEALTSSDIECTAKLYGNILSASDCREDIAQLLRKSHASPESPDFIFSMLALSNTLPLLNLRSKTLPDLDSEGLLDRLILALDTPATQSIALMCLAPVLKYGFLDTLDKDSKKVVIQKVMVYLRRRSLNNKSNLMNWSYLSLYATEYQFVDTFCDALDETHSSKQVDVLFYAGEGMTILAAGWHSKVLLHGEHLRVDDSDKLTVRFSDANAELILTRILSHCKASKPSLRKAACIWLLCFVQYLPHLTVIQNNARKIHLTFVSFLADSDDFVQESASRGLGIIYQVSDKDLQEEMLKGLLKSFTDTKATLAMRSGTVSSDTQLFEPGVMNTGDGSISTYKDILNLASEAGDPSLVYKFLPLAKSSALWSSRKGVAFGLTSIFSKISIDELLNSGSITGKKLIPLLYRYRFDPYSSVADAMKGIWQALVKNSNETVVEYSDEILSAALEGMGSKEWRTREASTEALRELLTISDQAKYHDRLEEIWTMAFRVMDDIKESVRASGLRLTKMLSVTLLRTVQGSSGQKRTSISILERLIPFFLGPKGLNSDADEVKAFALDTLLALIKDASAAIKSFAPSLIYEFTVLLSPLEPQAINYLTMNAEKYNLDASAVNLQRAIGIQQSPILKSIETLIGLCDANLLPEAVDKIIMASKRSVGLPSKVGSARSISLLVLQNPTELSAFGSKLIKACFSGLNDRSSIVSEEYAISFGRVCKACKPGKVVKYAAKLEEKYFSSDEASSKIVVGVAIESIFKYSMETFEKLNAAFMPLVFVAKHDESEASNVFSRTWNEASSSGSGSVRLYLEEIVALTARHLKSNSFDTKLTCAKSVCSACDQANPDTPRVIVSKLFDVMLETTKGRSWRGKEVVVETLVSLAKKFKDFLLENEGTKHAVDERLAAEISRENEVYVRRVIIPSVSYVTEFWTQSLSAKVLEISKKLINKIDSGANDQVSDGEDIDPSFKKQRITSDVTRKSQKENTSNEEFKIELLKGLATVIQGSGYSKDLLEFLTKATLELFESQNVIYSWRSQIAISEIGLLLSSSKIADPMTDIQESLKKLWNTSFNEASQPGSIESVQVQCVRFGKELMSKHVTFEFVVKNNLGELLRTSPSPVVVVELNKAGIN